MAAESSGGNPLLGPAEFKKLREGVSIIDKLICLLFRRKKGRLLSYSGGGLSQETPPGGGCSQEYFLYKFSCSLLSPARGDRPHPASFSFSLFSPLQHLFSRTPIKAARLWSPTSTHTTHPIHTVYRVGKCVCGATFFFRKPGPDGIKAARPNVS